MVSQNTRALYQHSANKNEDNNFSYYSYNQKWKQEKTYSTTCNNLTSASGFYAQGHQTRERENTHVCEFCCQVFAIVYTLKRHLITQHQTMLDCKFCKTICVSYSELALHLRFCNIKKSLECFGTTHLASEIVNVHNSDISVDTTYFNQFYQPPPNNYTYGNQVHCNTTHFSFNNFNTNMKCGKTVKNAHNYSSSPKPYLSTSIPAISAEVDAKYPCDICSKVLLTKVGYKLHMIKIHNYQTKSNKSVQCPMCLKNYSSLYVMKRHMAAIHCCKPICKKCYKRFETQEELNVHSAVCKVLHGKIQGGSKHCEDMQTDSAKTNTLNTKCTYNYCETDLSHNNCHLSVYPKQQYCAKCGLVYEELSEIQNHVCRFN